MCSHGKQYLDYFQFEVVPETVLYSSCLFLSEKVFKPILFKKPFLVLSSIHTLSYLRKLGFKTFEPVIDESYDFETDNVIRTLKVLQEVKKLCSMSHVMLRKKLDQLDEILEYNHNHFMSTDWHFNIQTEVQKYIKKYNYFGAYSKTPNNQTSRTLLVNDVEKWLVSNIESLPLTKAPTEVAKAS